MKQNKSYLNLRLDKVLHDKFQYVSTYEGRSMSAQVLWLVNKCVRDFEKENGPIPTDEDKPCDSWKY